MSCKSRSTFTEAARHPWDVKWHQHAWSVACMMKLGLVEGRSLKLYRKQGKSCVSPPGFSKFCLVLYSSYAAYHQPWPVKRRRKKKSLTWSLFMYVLISKTSFQIMLKTCWMSQPCPLFPTSRWATQQHSCLEVYILLVALLDHLCQCQVLCWCYCIVIVVLIPWDLAFKAHLMVLPHVQ